MKYLITIAASVLLLASCKKYLDVTPQGTLTEADVTTPESADGLVTAAYAAIGNDFWNGPITSLSISGRLS